MAKYYGARNEGDVVILYRRVGTKKKEKRVGPRSFAWYFCVDRPTMIKYKTIFKTLKDDGFIDRITLDDNPRYFRIYCQNKNIWHGDLERMDNKRHVLSTLNANRIPHYEADLSTADRLIIDQNIKVENKHRIAYFDIETRDDGEIAVGEHQIVSVAILDDEGQEFVFCEDDEFQLLRKAIARLSKYTMLCGWNSKEFDWEYIRRRCKLHQVGFTLYDVNHVDLMAWFEKAVTANMIAERPQSYKLDEVAKQYFGMAKTEGVIPGNGRIWNLFHTDREKLREYNLNDCVLLKAFDEHFSATELITKQSEITGCFAGRSTPTALTDNFILRLAKKEGERLPSRKDNRKPQKFPGGRCLIKDTSLYNYVLAFDFSGYYNTIMRYYNIGPDTKLTYNELRKIPKDKRGFPLIVSPYTYYNCRVIEKCYDELVKRGYEVTKDYQLVDNFKEVKLPVLEVPDTENMFNELEEITRVLWERESKIFTFSLEPFRYYFFRIRNIGEKIRIECRAPVYFRQDKESIVSKALTSYTEERGKWKKNKAALIAEGKQTDSKAVKNAELMSTAYKLLGNIVFGQMGNQYARIFHPALPPSITIAAQMMTMLTYKWFRNNGCDVLYIDTDSNYVVIGNGYSKEKLKALLSKFKKEFHSYLHDKVIKMFKANPTRPFVIELEFEKIWWRMMVLKKKRYAGRIIWDKDVGSCDKIDCRGIEVRRRGTPDFVTRVMTDLLEFLFKTDPMPTNREALDWALRWKAELLEADKNEDLVRSLVKRVVIKRKPSEYKSNAPQKRIVERIMARGEHFELGSFLPYVIIETPTTTDDGEEVEFFLENRDRLKIDYTYYWDKQTFSPCLKLLKEAFKAVPWISISIDGNRKQLKRFVQLVKRCVYTGNIQGYWQKTADMIMSYGMNDNSKDLSGFDMWNRALLIGLFIKNLPEAKDVDLRPLREFVASIPEGERIIPDEYMREVALNQKCVTKKKNTADVEAIECGKCGCSIQLVALTGPGAVSSKVWCPTCEALEAL